MIASLKAGRDVTLSDGRHITSTECFSSIVKQSRTCAVLQDTVDASSALPFLENCDLLVHECTYSNTHHQKALVHGHSTPSIAAGIARLCKARRLALTHFSPRYDSTDVLRVEALNDLVGSECEVILAEDFLEIAF